MHSVRRMAPQMERNLSAYHLGITVAAIVALGIIVICATTAIAKDERPQVRDWELVRSVSNPYGGTIDLVLIPEQKQRDRQYYLAVADSMCADRTSCMVNFWTNRAHIPTSASMPVTDLAVMTGLYERSPTYTAPVLSLACWLYPNRETAESMKCGYFPGAKVPWKMPGTEAPKRK